MTTLKFLTKVLFSNLLVLVVLFTFTEVVAQEIIKPEKDNDLKLSSLPYYSYGKGIGITSPDSLFQFNIRFRIQNRVSYVDNEDQDGYYEAIVRRLRLRFDGFVGNPKFLYTMQLSFGSGDVGGARVGENLNVIRDAMFYYRPNTHWQFGFGLTKLPGLRQTVNSSGAIQMTERSINNLRFSIDRDLGFHIANLNEYYDKFSYNFKGAVTMGEGRNWTINNPNSLLKENNGLAVTAKVELMPFGKFKKEGHYFEGDILREPKPRLMISGVLNNNFKARKSQGQLGELLFETRNLNSVLIDGIFKYQGFAAMAMYASRNAVNPITRNPALHTETSAVFVGHGNDYQMSYCFPSNYEVIGRYSTQNVKQEIKNFFPDSNQMSFGVNKYIREHALKLQAEFSVEEQNFYNGVVKNNWFVRFQIEIGI